MTPTRTNTSTHKHFLHKHTSDNKVQGPEPNFDLRRACMRAGMSVEYDALKKLDAKHARLLTGITCRERTIITFDGRNDVTRRKVLVPGASTFMTGRHVSEAMHRGRVQPLQVPRFAIDGHELRFLLKKLARDKTTFLKVS
jgi:hypothetical protein